MLLLRCSACGQGTPHREGVRFCAACGVALAVAGCPGCGRDVFWGDRHCACCGQALPEWQAIPTPAPAPSAWSGAVGPAPTPQAKPSPPVVPSPSLPAGLLNDFQHLAQEARSRAHAAEEQPLAPGKAHLTQDDIDRLFGVDE